MPVLLLTREESTDPAKREVGAVAAVPPTARLLVLPGQQLIADILDPETFARHLLGFLHGPTPVMTRGGSFGPGFVGSCSDSCCLGRWALPVCA